MSAPAGRADLYYRLQVFPVRLPPLRDRIDDIELLALYFAERMASHLNKPVPALSPAVLDMLRSYRWPGNLRELEHAIQRATIVCRGPVLEPGDVALGFGLALPAHNPFRNKHIESQAVGTAGGISPAGVAYRLLQDN